MELRETDLYSQLYKRYRDGEPEDIMYLYTLHRKLKEWEGDFHSVGMEVCKDVLRERSSDDRQESG